MAKANDGEREPVFFSLIWLRLERLPSAAATSRQEMEALRYERSKEASRGGEERKKTKTIKSERTRGRREGSVCRGFGDL